jgi:UDP-N-acetylglucosamine:LPS N-acetylglucosamine transferase
MVRGLPGGGIPLAGAGTNVYDHLSARAMNELFLRAGLIVARSGYSTVMDLVRLGKRSVLIPTPGQTEQEYLGQYLNSQRIALCMRQSRFMLKEALGKAEQFPYVKPEEEENLLQKVIDQSFSPVRLG